MAFLTACSSAFYPECRYKKRVALRKCSDSRCQVCKVCAGLLSEVCKDGHAVPHLDPCCENCFNLVLAWVNLFICKTYNCYTAVEFSHASHPCNFTNLFRPVGFEIDAYNVNCNCIAC